MMAYEKSLGLCRNLDLEYTSDVNEMILGHSLEPPLEFRDVAPGDKDEVLSLDKNAYDGLDFLTDYFDFLMKEPTVSCSAIMDRNEMVGFVATNEIDGGQTAHIQALRIKHSKQGLGYFRPFARKLVQNLLQTQHMRYTNVYGPEHDKGNGAVFNQKAIMNTMHFITPFVRKTAIVDNQEVTDENIKIVSPELIGENYFKCNKTKNYLFPSGRFVVELIPLALIPENLHLIKGRNSVHFSSIHEEGGKIRGMLSSAHTLNHQNGTSSYNITITGRSTNDLPKHLQLHYLRAMDLIEPPFCFQLFIENICIKDNIPLLLYNGMAKNGYVKVGTLIYYEVLLEPWRKMI